MVGTRLGGGTVNFTGTDGGGTVWSSAGLGLRLGEQLEEVDMGLYWPQLLELQLPPPLVGVLLLAEEAQVWPELELAEDQLPQVSRPELRSYSGL